MYAWQQPYFEAVLEIDDTRMSHHLFEALASIEQRLLSPINEETNEFKAIHTWLEVQRLLRERTDAGDTKVKALAV